MIPQLAMLVISITAVTFIGSNVLYIMGLRRLGLAAPETAAVSYGIGFGLVSLEMLLFYFLGWPFAVDRILAPWLVLVGINLVRYLRERRLSRPSDQAASARWGALDTFLACGIAFETAYAFFRALIKPIESYDAIAIYAIRSKIFYLAGAIPRDYFQSLARLFPHADYPLNMQLSESFLYLSMGSLNDQLVKMIFPLFFAATLCMLYFALRRIGSRTYALIFTFVLAGIPHFNNYATNAYLEVALAFYIFTSFVFLLKWIEDGENAGALAVSAVAAALAAWTKNEGLMYCAIFAALVFARALSKGRKIAKKDILYAMAYSAIILAICLPWALAKAEWQVVNDEIALSNLNPANLARQAHKIGPVAYEFQKQLFGPKKWNIFWPVMMAALVLNYRKLFKPQALYALAVIVLALCGYVVFYMISYVDVVFFASKTWARFMLDFLPIAVYLLAVLLRDDIVL